MAQKAEEYGSHDKTFEVEEDGVMRVVDSTVRKRDVARDAMREELGLL